MGYWELGYEAAEAQWDVAAIDNGPDPGLLDEIEVDPHQRAEAEAEFRRGWAYFAKQVGGGQ